GTVAGVTTANQTKLMGATSGVALTGLTNGTKYYVVVTSVSPSGESVVSGEANATPAPPPPAPTGIAVASGNAQATLTWPAVTGATSYNVYYRTTTGATTANSTKITNTTSGTAITGLTNGTAYFFVVTVVKGTNESLASSEVGATPQAPAAGVASGITVTGGIGQATLSWTAVTGASSYNVYYGTAAGVTTTTGTKVTGATSGNAIINLTNGSKYYFIVTAMSNANTIENPASTEVSATPMGIPNLMGGAIQTPLTLAGTVTSVSILATSYVATDGTKLYFTNNVDSAFPTINIANAQPSTTAGFPCACVAGPMDLTTDGNNIYSIGPGFNGAIPAIHKSPIAGGTSSVVTTGLSASPGGITTDGANLYVTAGNSIQRVVIATGVVTTIAGTAGLTGATNAIGAAARFNNPTGITTDGTYLYIADTGNNLIRKLLLADNSVTTVAGGFLGLTYDGTATGARFTAPQGITTDGTNLYVADTGAYAIRKIVLTTGVVTTLAGSYGVSGSAVGTGSAALFTVPRGITTDGTSLYVADSSGVIFKIQ
ncbi:MAG: hypothetical protein EPO42_10270, partial [Gallionellaceae bacterium]